MSTEYNPWRDLAERHPDVHAGRADLHPARAGVSADLGIILIDKRLRAHERRCSLAHEIAHLDLGHVPTDHLWFHRRQEIEADRLAAQRLITPPELAEALLWCRDDRELAAELHVDVRTVQARRAMLSDAEVADIEARLDHEAA